MAQPKRNLKPTVFERGHTLYIVAPVAPMQPSDQDIEEFAFADAVKRMRGIAPNPNIAWFGGHYVEADNPNANGAMWTADEIALKSVTPTFMPVTVMHDPSTAVGTIADVSLKTPQADSVPRAKLDTALALWAHRFPQAVEEAQFNYSQGCLMQSMECIAPDYSCSECGADYHKLPDGAEQEHWCECLSTSNPGAGYVATSGKKSTAVRILRNVVFTGTGLIFGSRGSKGADSKAYLESFQEEVATFHEEQRERSRHQPTRPKRRTPRVMDTVEISKSEYEALVASKAALAAAEKRADEAEEKAEGAETLKAENADLKEKVETAEAAKTAAEEKAEAAEAKVKEADESVAAESLAKERFEKLGDGFKAKLGDTSKKNLERDAKAMSEEDWASRVEELAEAYGIKPDAAGSAKTDETVFSKEEVASSKANGSGRSEESSSREAQSSVVGGLFSQAVKK